MRGGRAFQNGDRMTGANFIHPVGMSNAPLTTKSRNALGKKAFALHGRRFPIPDANHARNALARAANLPPDEKAKVHAAVKRKYPSIGS